MQTENDTSKPEDSPEPVTGEGCQKRLVLCLHCVHWGGNVSADSLAEYPLRSPDEEWRDGVCDKLKRELDIDINAGWEGGSVGYIRTTASFGCTYGELSPENS
jgi:hypothetical protein